MRRATRRILGEVKEEKNEDVFTAAAINFIRLDAFLEGTKTTKTRASRFAALAPIDLAS